MNPSIYSGESPEEIRKERATYRFFRLSVTLKGAFAALETVGGVLMLIIPPATILALVNFLTGGELSEEPTDFIATHIQSAAQTLISADTFIALYLLSRGLIKLFLVVALLKNKLWAYPLSLGVLGLFILYQIYQMAVSFSWIVFLITIFDFIVIYFIWKEYTIVKEHHEQRIV